MAIAADNALIVQSDCSVLLDVHAPRAEEARAALAPFAELVKSPEHVHTYRLTPLSIWNARAAGLAAEQMVAALREHARYAVPPNVEQEILELAARYGRVVITRDGDWLRCTCLDEATAERLSRDREAGQYLSRPPRRHSFRVDPGRRGVLKQALVGARVPRRGPGGLRGRRAACDRCASTPAGDVRGARLPAAGGRGLLPWRDRARAAAAWWSFPAAPARPSWAWPRWRLVGQTTLILTTSLTAVQQWRRELLDKTTLRRTTSPSTPASGRTPAR